MDDIFMNSENVSHLENTEVVLILCNIVNNKYQQDSRVLFTFVPKIIWSITRYFNQEFYILKNF